MMTYQRPAPFTHAAYVQKFGLLEGVKPLSIKVQILRRGVTYCGTLADVWTAPNGMECWTVQTTSPEFARFTTPCCNVVECPNDGHCTCVSASGFSANFATPAAVDFCHARVVAPRDSLIIEKTLNLALPSEVSCGV